MARTLILYHSGYGHTRKISERVARVMSEAGEAVETRALLNDDGDCTGDELAAFDTIVIGASIRNGKHQPAVIEFINRHRELLRSRNGVFFSVNLVARKPGKDTPGTALIRIPGPRSFRRLGWSGAPCRSRRRPASAGRSSGFRFGNH